MSKISHSNEQEEVLRLRKRVSRNEETLMSNALLYILVKLGFDVKVKRTKKTTHTIKMLIIEEMTHRETGKVMNQCEVAYFSQFILNKLGYQHLDETKMTLKQLKRTREAQLSNALLFFLNSVGYSFEEKKTKKAKCTERLIRIQSLQFNEIIYSKELLSELGESVESTVRNNFNSQYVVITNMNLEDKNLYLPECNFDSVLQKAIQIQMPQKTCKEEKKTKKTSCKKSSESIKIIGNEFVDNKNVKKEERILQTPSQQMGALLESIPQQQCLNYIDQPHFIFNTYDNGEMGYEGFYQNIIYCGEPVMFYTQTEPNGFFQNYYCC